MAAVEAVVEGQLCCADCLLAIELAGSVVWLVPGRCLVAVTGTNGKTTTAYLVAAVVEMDAATWMLAVRPSSEQVLWGASGTK